MMSKNVRILMIAVGLVLLGSVSVVSATSPVPDIRDMVVDSGPSGPIIHLTSASGFDTVHYSPQPGVWVVEMPEVTWAEAAAVVSRTDVGIEKAELSQVEEFGRQHSRLTVWLSSPASLDIEESTSGLDLDFTLLQTATETAAVDDPVDQQPSQPAVASQQLASLPRVTAATAPKPVTPAPTGTSTSLLSVECARSGNGAVIKLHGDGALEGRSFTLPAPDRLVVDLDGVVNRADQYVYSVESPLVQRVRVAQHQGYPDPITRLVVDLHDAADYHLESTSDGAILTIGDARVDPAPAPIASSHGVTITNIGGDGSISVVGDDAATAMAAKPAPAPPQPEKVTPPPIEQGAAMPIVDRNPWQADPTQLVEKGAAATELDLPVDQKQNYQPTEVETEEVQFTGDPISLTLKDADIKDVLKTFSALTQLNIVIDPEVSGSVTVELRDVPWDQALDLILRINGLDYVLENNVLRVSTVNKLNAEKVERAKYLVSQEDAQPLKTVVKPLSYAAAAAVSKLLSGDSYLMSSRGTVVVDSRTNTLIIRDTIDRVEGILRLIDTLDQPTPQVVIEGRIVETTRTFSHELGVDWGFNSVNDVQHGNTTGLRFPHTITSEGNVNLRGAGTNGVLAFTFGDILNTFNLDFTLAAAEAEGTAKIVSTPRVTTQNLKTASIRSGLQIPVQTVSNNTVTVQYVDATLRLQVTPQITADGTVNLQIDIKKQQPLQAGQITGGNNAPIQTRDAQTELLVRDGGTTVIGGIYQIDDEDQKNRVPGLWKIPLLGKLFQQHAVTQRHDELLIFITPRIVKY